jgi:hypothetical protein
MQATVARELLSVLVVGVPLSGASRAFARTGAETEKRYYESVAGRGETPGAVTTSATSSGTANQPVVSGIEIS